MVDTGIIAIASLISPYARDRQKIRSRLAPGDFIEVTSHQAHPDLSIPLRLEVLPSLVHLLHFRQAQQQPFIMTLCYCRECHYPLLFVDSARHVSRLEKRLH